MTPDKVVWVTARGSAVPAAGKHPIDLPQDLHPTRINNVIAVSSRALTIVWEDGHDYGIYNWHYLRALCPCHEDQAKYRNRN